MERTNMTMSQSLTPKKLMPLFVMLVVVYVATLAFRFEPLVVGVTVFLAGWAALLGSVYLRIAIAEKGAGFQVAAVIANFVLTAVLTFLLLKLLADVVF